MLELPPFTVTPQVVERIERVGGSVRVDVVDVVDGGCCGQEYVYAAGPARPGDRRRGADRRSPGLRLDAETAPVPGDGQFQYGGALPVQPVVRCTVAGARATAMPGPYADAVGRLGRVRAKSATSR